MRVTRVVTCAALAAVTLAGSTACIAPSDYIYAVGVARLGDHYAVYAPLCDDERLTSVVIEDVTGEETDPGYGAVYWSAVGPRNSTVAKGWFSIGAEGEFGDASGSSGGDDLPDRVRITVKGTWAKGRFSVGDVFTADGVPYYPATADPATMRYEFRIGSTEQKTLPPNDIREASACARDNIQE